MRTKIIVSFIFILSFISISAQKATITFKSDKDITVWISAPIDGAYNPHINTDSIMIIKNVDINYKIDVDSFAFLKTLFSDGYRCNFLLLPNSNNTIVYKNNLVLFEGQNSEGQNYLHYKFQRMGLGFYTTKIDSIFKNNITDKINFYDIDNAIDSKLLKPCLNYLYNLERENKISKIFSNLLAKNINYAFFNYIFRNYNNILNKEINNYTPTAIDSIKIVKRIHNLYKEPEFINHETLKYNYTFTFFDYYLLKWNSLTKEERALLRDGYERDIFGKCIVYLTSPKSMQPILFAKEMLEEKTLGIESFNHRRLLNYMKEKFPTSEYIPIISKMLEDQIKTNASPVTLVKHIKDGSKINSLKDLIQISELKGKYIYIDLWSVPCMPCRYEFQFNDELHKLLSKYENLTQVYISTDPVEQDSVWRKTIEKYKLNSYNIRASANLQKELSEKLYNGGSIYIPRYILLDQNANIINDNLPRPSKMNLLEEALDKVFKK